MPKPPITNKPIPRTLKEWGHEVSGWWRYLKRVNKLKEANGLNWVKGQKVYARKRLCDLVDNKPRGGVVPPAVQAWRKRQNL